MIVLAAPTLLVLFVLALCCGVRPGAAIGAALFGALLGLIGLVIVLAAGP